LEARTVERKLAAIFAADVEGYSRLLGRDEVGTLRGGFSLTQRCFSGDAVSAARSVIQTGDYDYAWRIGQRTATSPRRV
jgi:class 3 adenylate cyclase